jgi:hypothetical protein
MNIAIAKSQNSEIQYKKPNNLIGDWIKNHEQLTIAQTFSEKKIEQFNKNDMAQLVDAISNWQVMLGIGNDTSEQELIFICQFIYDNFGWLTLTDVNMTMKLVVSQKIKLEYTSQKKITALYVSKSLNAFIDYKTELYNEILKNKAKHIDKLEENNVRVLSKLEKANDFKNHCIAMYKNYEQDGWAIDFGDFFYNWMKRLNIINDALIPQALSYAESRYIDDKKNPNSLAMQIKMGLNNIESIKFQKKKYAREFVVNKFFSENDIIDIIQLIKQEQF